MARSKSIKFERNYGLIILPVCILHNEKLIKVDMALDTGAYLTLLTPNVASDLK